MGVHDGHRQRMIQRFMENGLDNFQEHEILELLLFYCIPRQNTNPLAHTLIDTFGSLSGVLNASPHTLQEIPGVGANTAAFLTLLPHITRIYYCQQQEEKGLNAPNALGEYLLSKFLGLQNEVVFVLCLDAKGKMISCEKIHEGGMSAAEIPLNKLLNTAVKNRASQVILAHNHPSGLATPSREDVAVTKTIKDILYAAGIRLTDHIIVGGNDYTSMADSGLLSIIR